MMTENIEKDVKTLMEDLHELRSYICGIRQDLSSLTPSNLPGIHLPEANNELGVVISTTETAANRILDACQEFESVIAQSGSADPKLVLALSTIYEACSFQDLTGQRIVKVRKMLVIVEEKLNCVFDKLGIVPKEYTECVLNDDNMAAERTLMNGPAMPGQGVDQADIDAMFN
jgi:chemotaxis protein CheZ